jgi:DNA-binding SARP family transcriptional activator
LTVDQEQVPLVASAQRLLALLALADRPLGRNHIAGVLWPDTTILRANANLRTSLWRVQRTHSHLIATSPQQLTLAAEVGVDLRHVARCARRLLDRHASCDDILTADTRAELSVDLLPDWYDDDWLLMEREQFHQLRLHALEAMCERLTEAGRYGEAIDAGLAAVRAEPLRESAHEVVMKAHLAAGNRWEAIRQYEHCRLLLREEMALEPSATLHDLLLLARAQRPPAGPALRPGNGRQRTFQVTSA